MVALPTRFQISDVALAKAFRKAKADGQRVESLDGRLREGCLNSR